MIVCAHIDDETFAMGGTINKLSKNNEVFLVTLCQGAMFPKLENRKEILEKYNINKKVFSNYDLTLEDYTLRSTIQQLEPLFREFRPEIVFTHSKDNHPDHNLVSEAVQILSRLKYDYIKKLYHFSIPGNSEWSGSEFKADTFIEISEEDALFKYKLAEMYSSLFNYSKNNPLYYKKIQSRDEYVGSLCNVDKAEQFQLILSKEL